MYGTLKGTNLGAFAIAVSLWLMRSSKTTAQATSHWDGPLPWNGPVAIAPSYYIISKSLQSQVQSIHILSSSQLPCKPGLVNKMGTKGTQWPREIFSMLQLPKQITASYIHINKHIQFCCWSHLPIALCVCAGVPVHMWLCLCWGIIFLLSISAQFSVCTCGHIVGLLSSFYHMTKSSISVKSA